MLLMVSLQALKPLLYRNQRILNLLSHLMRINRHLRIQLLLIYMYILNHILYRRRIPQLNLRQKLNPPPQQSLKYQPLEPRLPLSLLELLSLQVQLLYELMPLHLVLLLPLLHPCHDLFQHFFSETLVLFILLVSGEDLDEG